jgi:RimJ/RimL family protein N-acetyltransferase
VVDIDSIRIVPTAEEYAESLHACLDSVARERIHLALVEAPPIEAVRGFVRALVSGLGVQFLAVDESNEVVGWCDIVRKPLEGFRHSGQLGMGVASRARGAGLGRRLAIATIEGAWATGLERIELEVFASNERALQLYRTLGFVEEGVRRRARKLDGVYDDNILMALLRDRTTT